MKKKQLINFLIVLSVLGLVVSTYLTYHHFTPLADAPCDVNDSVSCSIVNRSSYAEIAGIPVAILGIIWFVVFGLLSQLIKQRSSLINYLTFWSTAGFISLFYYIYAEWMLRSICLYCTIVHVIVLIQFVIVLYLHKNKPK